MTKRQSLTIKSVKIYNVADVVKCVEEYRKFRVECCICGKVDSYTDDLELVTPKAFAEGLFKDGWRYESSNKFQVIGAMCPECFSQPDDKRGE